MSDLRRLAALALALAACGDGASPGPSNDASTPDVAADEGTPMDDGGDGSVETSTDADAGGAAADASCTPLGACPADGAAGAPCVPDCRGGSVCRDPAAGTCDCGFILDDMCSQGRKCICPSCGEGHGLCVSPDERTALCAGPFASGFACP